METTWIFIIVGIFILFFLFSHTIYITTSTSTAPIDPTNNCGISTYGCCPDKITARKDSSGTNCSQIPSSTTPGTAPSPYVNQNVANTTPTE